jgi:hypothetical protein
MPPETHFDVVAQVVRCAEAPLALHAPDRWGQGIRWCAASSRAVASFSGRRCAQARVAEHQVSASRARAIHSAA